MSDSELNVSRKTIAEMSANLAHFFLPGNRRLTGSALTGSALTAVFGNILAQLARERFGWSATK